MKTLNRTVAPVVLIIGIALFCANAVADVYVPPAPGLGSLDHGSYYIWGIDINWDPLVDEAKGATLFLNNLQNWDNSDNDLWIHLLDYAPLGITSGSDGGDGVDEFLNPIYDEEILLIHYVNLSSTGEDKMHIFDAAQVDKLNEFAADGRIAIALDPDCHFYNCGVELDISSAGIPEPATFLITGLGMGLIALVRKSKKA